MKADENFDHNLKMLLSDCGEEKTLPEVDKQEIGRNIIDACNSLPKLAKIKNASMVMFARLSAAAAFIAVMLVCAVLMLPKEPSKPLEKPVSVNTKFYSSIEMLEVFNDSGLEGLGHYLDHGPSMSKEPKLTVCMLLAEIDESY